MSNKKTKNILSLIEDTLHTSSKSHKKLSSYLLDNYVSASYMTAQKLSEAVGVSEATITRYAVLLGYEGYPEFQSSLRNIAMGTLTSVQRIKVAEERLGSDIIGASFSADIETLRKTLANIDHEVFYGIIDLLLEAKKVFIIGTRSSTSLAYFFNFHLSLILDNVRLVQYASGSDIFEQLVKVGEGDLVIGISFPRYSKRTVDGLDFAKRQGADIIAITDSVQSPLVSYADRVLYAANQTDSFVDSLVAPMALINALIAAIGQRKKSELEESFSKLEDVWEEYKIYDKFGTDK